MRECAGVDGGGGENACAARRSKAGLFRKSRGAAEAEAEKGSVHGWPGERSGEEGGEESAWGGTGSGEKGRSY